MLDFPTNQKHCLLLNGSSYTLACFFIKSPLMGLQIHALFITQGMVSCLCWPPEQKPGGLYREGRWEFTSLCLTPNRVSDQSRFVCSMPLPHAIGPWWDQWNKKLGSPSPGFWVVVWWNKPVHQLAHFWCTQFSLYEIYLGKKSFYHFQIFHFILLIILGW